METEQIVLLCHCHDCGHGFRERTDYEFYREFPDVQCPQCHGYEVDVEMKP